MVEIIIEILGYALMFGILCGYLAELNQYLERKRYLQSPEFKENRRNVVRFIQFKKTVKQLEEKAGDYDSKRR